MQRRPIGGNELGRIEIGPAPANRSNDRRGQFTVADREIDAIVVGLDVAARSFGGRTDVASSLARLRRRQKTAQPPVAVGADAAKCGRRRAADPNIKWWFRFGQYPGAFDGEELSGERDVIVAQSDAQQLQRL